MLACATEPTKPAFHIDPTLTYYGEQIPVEAGEPYSAAFQAGTRVHAQTRIVDSRGYGAESGTCFYLVQPSADPRPALTDDRFTPMFPLHNYNEQAEAKKGASFVGVLPPHGGSLHLIVQCKDDEGKQLYVGNSKQQLLVSNFIVRP